MKTNPYSLTFGQEPRQYISRNEEISTIINQFTADDLAQQCYMITGLRGTGKTVFADSIKSRLSNDKNWIVFELNSSDNLLNALAEKLVETRRFTKWFKEAKINLSAFGIDLEISGEPKIYNIETAIIKLLKTLKKHNQKVLVVIDEVTNTQQMKIFASAYQIFLREKLPIYLIMTGLYENVKELKDEKNLTFLYRTPSINLDPLSVYSIADNYETTLNVDETTAKKMANITKGYSFAFQALGYVTFEENEFNNKAIKKYKTILYDYSYKKIWSELSNQDRKVVYAIAKTKTGQYGDILKELNIDKNHLNPYRKRLLEKGIVVSPERGRLTFTLPYFEEFAIESYEDDFYYTTI